MRYAQHLANWRNEYRNNERFRFDTVLDEIKVAGFTGVEVNDELGAWGSATEIKTQMADHHLQFAAFMSSVMINGYSFDRERYWREIAFAAELGIRVITIPGDLSGQPSEKMTELDYQPFAEHMAEAYNDASKNGQIIAYHPSYENYVQPLEEMRHIWKYLPNVSLCVDLADFVALDSDPVELITLFPDRIIHIHLKDWHAQSRRFANLGEGDVGNFPRIFRALQNIGYDGWLTVENGEPLMPAGELAIQASRSLGETGKSL